jgi:hypothetical protein
MSSVALTFLGLGCILAGLFACDWRDTRYSILRFPLAVAGALLVCVAIITLP